MTRPWASHRAPIRAWPGRRVAVAGGVAGHYMHHHAVMGAVGGCIAAHEYYKHKAKQAAMAQPTAGMAP